MLKLTIISGPNRGSSYVLTEGESSVGRQSDNAIVVASSRVSKRHCVFVVRAGEVTVQDQHSANGTYVNGALIKSKTIKDGDRISVGNVVFELRQALQRSLSDAPAAAFPVPGGLSSRPSVDVMAEAAETMPTDLRGRIQWIIEKSIMPFFYNLVLRYQWRTVLGGSILVLVTVALVATIQPMLDSAQQTILEELKRKSQLIAHQIVDLNQGQIQLGSGDTKARAGIFEQEDGVRFAVITDLELRVLAPEAKAGRRISSGEEARLVLAASKLYLQGQAGGVVRVVGGDTVVAVEPVLALDPSKGRNVVVAMAVVSLDATMSRPEWGQIGMIYSQAMLILGITAILTFFVLYRVTLKPLEVLNEDMDKVLKGELGQVTREFKWEETTSLFDVVNSALQRIPMSRSFGGGDTSQASVSLNDYTGLFSAVGSSAKAGMVVCNADRKIVFMNAVFEELSGIRADQARGEDLRSIARDQALGAMANDLFDRAHSASGESIQEDFDFSGIVYKLTAVLFGGGEAKGFVLIASKVDGV